jgi:hypothetical protein
VIYTKSVIDDLENMDRNTARAVIEDMTDYGYDERGKWHAPKPVRPLWHYNIALGVAVTVPVWACAMWAIVRFFWGK